MQTPGAPVLEPCPLSPRPNLGLPFSKRSAVGCPAQPLPSSAWHPALPGVFNPNSEDPLPGQLKKQLVLRIISGQQLPKPRDSMLGDRGEVGGPWHGWVGLERHAGPGATPALRTQIIDPFVEVEVIGLPVDCNKEQTRVVDDNGEAPGPLAPLATASQGRERWGCSWDPDNLPAAPSLGPLSEPGPQALLLSAGSPAQAEALEEGVGPSGLQAGPGVGGDTCSPWPLGFNPMWEETLVFTVHMPEIALVRFLVWDHDPIGRDFIGQRTLAFSSMMPGGQGGPAGWGGAASPI